MRGEQFRQGGVVTRKGQRGEWRRGEQTRLGEESRRGEQERSQGEESRRDEKGEVMACSVNRIT
jgi:hypothetical protein